MRDFTQEELKNDYKSLQLELITQKGADRLSQAFHFNEFFAHQLAAWKELPIVRKKAYMAKFPEDTTFADFFKSFAKDFRTKKYTTFNIEMMYELIRLVKPSTIIDPCMGWGQRMILSTALGIDYYGTDVNQKTVNNNHKLYHYLETEDPTIPFAALREDDGVNAPDMTPDADNTLVFTCPPYYDREVYSEEGIENATYEEYLAWWKELAQKSFDKGIPFFAFQITPKYGEDLQRVTEEAGYQHSLNIANTRFEKEEMHIDVKGNKGKRNYGQVYLFSHPKNSNWKRKK